MSNNYVLLETIALTQSAASVTFDNLPTSGYTDLKIVASVRGDSANVYNYCRIRFNGDTGSNYNMQILYGDSGVAGSTPASGTSITGGLYAGSSSTANTFSNSEWYIPNYRGSTQKSLSIDAVTENNSATSSNGYLTAALWTGTVAITSATLLPNSGNFVANSTFSLYGIAAFGTTPVFAPQATGGNIVANDGTYWYHAFTSSGNFVPQTALTCDYLVIAGGGGGARYTPSGGGAGGLRSTVTATGGGGSLESALSLISNTLYAVSIGAGGAGAATNLVAGGDGSTTTFSTISCVGGGGGINESSGPARSGGSGGGGGREWPAAGAGTANQGFAGGTGVSAPQFSGGGGGGAGAVGVNATTGGGGNGGAGVLISAFATPTTTGVSGYYAGGGAGASYAGTAGTGGIGGGGNGGINPTAGTSGIANTGGGGGASGADGGGVISNAGGSGGSGIVIIRYPIA